MTAQYFLDRLNGYKEEQRKTNKSCYDYENGYVHIHEKDNYDVSFTIYSDGTFTETNLKDTSGNKDSYGEVEKLTGDNFEIFSNIQVIDSKYLVFTIPAGWDINAIIGDILDIVGENEKTHMKFMTRNKRNRICNAEYISSNDITINIMTISNLCKENVSRKFFDKRCFPFNKQMKNENAIYISFSDVMWCSTEKERQQRTKDAWEELKEFVKSSPSLKQLVRYSVDCPVNYPLYL